MTRLTVQLVGLLLALWVAYRGIHSAYTSYSALDERVRTETAAERLPAAEPADVLALPARPALSAYDTTVSQPVFFEGRRYPMRQQTAASSEARPEQAATPDQGLSGARLRGVVLAGGTARALIEMPGAPPTWISKGEAVDGWRLDAIAPDEAKLINGRAVAILSLYAPSR